jgi:hypothetical protein
LDLSIGSVQLSGTVPWIWDSSYLPVQPVHAWTPEGAPAPGTSQIVSYGMVLVWYWYGELKQLPQVLEIGLTMTYPTSLVQPDDRKGLWPRQLAKAAGQSDHCAVVNFSLESMKHQ